MADIKVSFPAPCGEQWDQMVPRGCNRHCSKCDTVIHDLAALTVDQVTKLLESEREICVKATIRPDGMIRTANSRSPKFRRMVAAIGATASLATAACETTSSSKVSPRYEISGNVSQQSWASMAKLQSSTGKIYTAKIWGDQKFRFRNLRPGTYTLSIIGTCEEISKFENINVDRDIILNDIDTDNQADCIIIGKMEIADTKIRQA